MSIDKYTASDFVNDNDRYYVADPKAIDRLCDSGNADAVAIWVYLTNKPKNWRVRPQQLKDKFTLGRDRYSAAVKVLKACGVFKTASLRKDGQFAGSVTMVSNKLGKYTEEQNIQISVGSEAPSIQVTDMPVDRSDGAPPIRSTDIALTKSDTLNKSDSLDKADGVTKHPRPTHDWQFGQKEFETETMHQFLSIYPKNPRTKTEFRRQWWIQGCEDIGELLIAKLRKQLSTCAEYESAKFCPVPDAYIADRKWENKITSKGDDDDVSPGKVLVRP